MALSQLTPLTSPLDERQLATLQTALTGLSPLQIAWVSGFLAGCSGLAEAVADAPAASPAPGLTILYGSQTGNTRSMAEGLAAQARARAAAVWIFVHDDLLFTGLNGLGAENGGAEWMPCRCQHGGRREMT